MQNRLEWANDQLVAPPRFENLGSISRFTHVLSSVTMIKAEMFLMC